MAKIEALHPGERRGYALQLARLAADSCPHDMRAHLVRERDREWPQLVLALRSDQRCLAEYAFTALSQGGGVREAAPWLLSILRRPAFRGRIDRHVLIAEHYHALVGPNRDLIYEWLPYLDPKTDRPLPDHAFRPDLGVFAFRLVAGCLLASFASDDRVFLGYLHCFADTHPYSTEAIKKRKKDARVVEILRAALDEEERGAVRAQRGRQIEYRDQYGILARYLAKLGDPRGVECMDRYAKYERWLSRPGPL